MVLKFRSGLHQHMNRPLKRQLVIRSHARESWDRRVHGFKVCKVDRVFQTAQLLHEFWTEPRLASLHARSRTSLALVQGEVVRDVEDGRNAHLLKLLNRAGLDSWQVPDVISRARRIASVEELARDWVRAVRSGRKVGSLRLVEDAEERPHPKGEIVLQFFDAAGQVPDPEEPPHVDVAPLINVVAVDVRQTRRRSLAR